MGRWSHIGRGTCDDLEAVTDGVRVIPIRSLRNELSHDYRIAAVQHSKAKSCRFSCVLIFYASCFSSFWRGASMFAAFKPSKVPINPWIQSLCAVGGIFPDAQ